jgi:hypothetical protein
MLIDIFIDLLYTTLSIAIVPLISILAKFLIDFVNDRRAETATADIKQSIAKAESERKTAIPAEVINKVEIFWIKIRDRTLYDVEDITSQQRCMILLERSATMIEEAKAAKDVERISAAYEIIRYANSIINSLNSSRIYAAGLLFVFVTSLVTLASLSWNKWEVFLPVVVLGVPLPVLLWGAIGGATAPLYKYLGFRGRYSEDSFKSFVLRPFIGTLMGAVIYLVVKSGLIVFGNIPDPEVANPELLWIFAFVGGFSESITGRALRLIEGTIGNGNAPEVPSGQISAQQSREDLQKANIGTRIGNGSAGQTVIAAVHGEVAPISDQEQVIVPSASASQTALDGHIKEEE